jgi:hypothetical protein
MRAEWLLLKTSFDRVDVGDEGAKRTPYWTSANIGN